MEKNHHPARRPSRVAWAVTWAGFALGSAASVGANVAHARPTLLAQLVAAWAPVALFVVVETLIHVPSARHWAPRWLRYVGTAVVAIVAAVASFRHMAELALAVGEDPSSAYTLPLSVDGLVLVTSLSLVALADRRAAAIAAADAAAAAGAERTAARAAAETAGADGAAAAQTAAERAAASRAAAERAAADLAAAARPPAEPESPDAARRRILADTDEILDRAAAAVNAYDAETTQLWASARAAFRKELADGVVLTGLTLAERFGRSERWGRDRITEAKAGDFYRASLSAGTEIDAAGLGAQFGKDPRWGATRIAEVAAEDAETALVA